jgi:hypothetical protein
MPWLTRLNSVEQDLERFSLRVAPASYSLDHLDQKIASLCEDVGAIFQIIEPKGSSPPRSFRQYQVDG